MKINFSDHALCQLEQRNLPRVLVEDAVISSHRIVNQSDSRFRALKQLTIKGRLYVLVVVFDQSNQTRTIVTAFVTSKVEKYL